MTGDPKILGTSLLAGIIPSLIWLWFWLKEDKKNSEPNTLLTMVFILGMISVVLVLPIEKFIESNIAASLHRLIFWAASEEAIKYLAAAVIIYRNPHVDEPLDWPIYLITAGLGFAALENALFLLKPFSIGETTVGLLTGQLRFLGSTLLHAVASGIIGIALGMSFHAKPFTKKFYLLAGFLAATTLHVAFNFFIMKNSGSDFLKVFAFLWVATVLVLLLFEKLRRMS